METRDEAALAEDAVDPDPLVQVGRWFEEARSAGGFDREAMAVATASADGAPSLRTMLLNGFDTRGFRFYTNYASRKGRELAENPRAALLFHWQELGRQLRVEGPVERLPAAESRAYFEGRSLESRLSALASPQSRVVGSREELERRVHELRHAGEVSAPGDWGGFLLRPRVYELWQHREHRLHDRLRYRREHDGEWVLERLAP